MIRTRLALLATAVLLPAAAAQATTYECRVTAVWSPLTIPERSYLARTRPSLRLHDSDDGTDVLRCTRDPARKKRTCRTIPIDWMAEDPAHGSRKFYQFATHYDLQLFADRTFVENDGNGVILHGKCRITEG